MFTAICWLFHRRHWQEKDSCGRGYVLCHKCLRAWGLWFVLALALCLAAPQARAAECTPIVEVVKYVASEPSLRFIEMSNSEQKTALELLHAIVNGLPESVDFVVMIEHSSGIGMFLVGENREICGRLIVGDVDEWAKFKKGILDRRVGY